MSFQAGNECDVRTCGASGASTAGFSYDSNYPQLASGATFWYDLLQYKLWGTIPTGNRVLCGITVPAPSTVMADALAAASRMSVPTTDDDTPLTISNRCITAAGSPWT